MSENGLKFPKKPYKTFGGVTVPHRKSTSVSESIIMPAPKRVVIPMKQHVGAACMPVVKVGEYVRVGQIIGDNESYICAPIHASISGTVTKIGDIVMPNGEKVQTVVIESDGQMAEDPGLYPPIVTNLNDLIRASRSSGLVGLGGAGFPAHVKLNLPEGKSVDTLIVNVAECEPYVTSDHREAIENSWAVLSGVYAIKQILKIKRVIIAVEENKPDVIEELEKIAYNRARDPRNEVRVLALKCNYPQGAEKVLIQACTGRQVPQDKLPVDVGCLVMNVTSVAFLANYMKSGMPLVSKRVTVDGTAIKRPCNVIVPIGTSVADVIAFCGGYLQTPKKLTMGGPMMGLALSDDSVPVMKHTNAIIAFGENEARLPEQSDCIRCGRCIKACPMRLVPPAISKAVKAKDVDLAKRLGIMSCMECGCCSFSCPAHRFIVQTMRTGKDMVKNSEQR